MMQILNAGQFDRYQHLFNWFKLIPIDLIFHCTRWHRLKSTVQKDVVGAEKMELSAINAQGKYNGTIAEYLDRAAMLGNSIDNRRTSTGTDMVGFHILSVKYTKQFDL